MNTIMRRLCDSQEATQHGLTTAPVGADGRSHLDQLTNTPWSDIHHLGRRAAGALQRDGVTPGDVVAVLAGAPGEIAPLVQGAWMCGAAVTMLHQPTHRSDLQAWAADTKKTLSMVGASTVVVGSPFQSAAQEFAKVGLRGLELSELLTADEGRIVGADEDSPAFLQLTSGSTGHPKAVSITYRNIEANGRALMAAASADVASDVVVSWLPLFHDMGMMGLLIIPMYEGMDAVHITPADFLNDPLLWAELITKDRKSVV